MTLFDGVTVAGMTDEQLVREYVKFARSDLAAPELQPVRAELTKRDLGLAAGTALLAAEIFPDASEPELR